MPWQRSLDEAHTPQLLMHILGLWRSLRLTSANGFSTKIKGRGVFRRHLLLSSQEIRCYSGSTRDKSNHLQSMWALCQCRGLWKFQLWYRWQVECSFSLKPLQTAQMCNDHIDTVTLSGPASPARLVWVRRTPRHKSKTSVFMNNF